MTNYSGKQLHIVAMDVPYPPDYGGVIDVFYKIKALSELGIKIHLHCFQYGRPSSEALSQYCEKVYYYPRKTGIAGLSFRYPYMMYSRRDKKLLDDLIATDAPILLEGVHCCYYLNHPSLRERTILLRNHNVEADYFRQLQYRSGNLVSRLYYMVESRLLARTERRLHRADAFITISETDYNFFRKLYPRHNHAFIPAFTDSAPLTELPKGKGSYIFYQGNLGHPENIEAIEFILQQVASALPEFRFVFAGKAPYAGLAVAGQRLSNVSVIANPSMEEMDRLIRDAHINLLLTFQATGLKLKLLAAIRKGRFVLANDAMLAGSGLEATCITANDPESIHQAIRDTMTRAFAEDDIQRRIAALQMYYSQDRNAATIADLAFGQSGKK